MNIIHSIIKYSHIIIFETIFVFIISANTSVDRKIQDKGNIRADSGIKIIENPAKPIYSGEALSLDLKKEISSGDKKSGYLFNRIGDIAVDKDGDIFILDIRERNIKVFDRDGRYKGSIGREGYGPGELSDVNEIEVGKEYIYALNTNGHRIHILDKKGNYINSVILTNRISQLRVDQNGLFYGTVFDGQKYEAVRYDKEFKKKDVFDVREWEAPRYFQAGMTIDLTSDGELVIGNPKKYEFIVYDTNKEEKTIIKKKYSPIKILKNDIDSIKMREWTIPEYHEPYYRLYVDDAEKVIVNTFYRLKEIPKSYYDLFDIKGKYLASFEIDTYKHMLWKRDCLYVSGEDKEGLPVVRIYNIRWRYLEGK